jgi:hypothetical protein
MSRFSVTGPIAGFASMKKRAAEIVVVGVCIWLLSPKAFAETIPEIVARAKQAVIEVSALDAQGKVVGTGTAFFIRSDGLAVTNAHVIQGASRIVGVSNTGAQYWFERVVSRPPGVDLALLKFSAVDVPYLSLGSSRTAVEGQRVLVIGNPEGLQGTVSDGLISAFRADHSLIQISAPISPGSSGSPVLTEDGKVIGVASLQHVNGQNLNFAIASEEVEKVERMATTNDVSSHPTAVVAATPKPSSTPNPASQYLLPPQNIFDPDYAQVRAEYQTAADAGNVQCMTYMGWIYQHGWGVAQDYVKARKWFQKGADAGDGLAMNGLGVLYQYGQGVARNYTQAREWYRKVGRAVRVRQRCHPRQRPSPGLVPKGR